MKTEIIDLDHGSLARLLYCKQEYSSHDEERDMELWMKLLFGNPIGLMSMIVIFATFIVISYLLYILYDKSKEESK